MRSADPQPKAADLAGRDVDVILARHQAVAAHEAETLVDDVENPGGVGVAGQLALPDQDAIDELFPCRWARPPSRGSRADGLELVDVHLAELGDVELAAVALLVFVIIAHGRAAGGAASRAAVAGTLVGTVDRHEGRAHLGKVPCKLFARNRSAAGARSG